VVDSPPLLLLPQKPARKKQDQTQTDGQTTSLCSALLCSTGMAHGRQTFRPRRPPLHALTSVRSNNPGRQVFRPFSMADLFLYSNLSDSVCLNRSVNIKIADIRLRRGVYPAVSRPPKKHCAASLLFHGRAPQREVELRPTPPLSFLGRTPPREVSCTPGAPSLPCRRPTPFLVGILAGILDS
jgi:hypothetical protein